MALLRVALLCLVSVASADVRLATNIECVVPNDAEVFLDLSGARIAATVPRGDAQR